MFPKRRVLTLPPACVTGIGSLPITSADQAVEFVAEMCPQLPFWPQLPQRNSKERMVIQSLGPLTEGMSPRESYGFDVARKDLDGFLLKLEQVPTKLDPEYAAGFFVFEKALKGGAFPHAQAVKGQVDGPVTVSRYLFTNDRPFVENVSLLTALGDYLSRLAEWQLELLSRSGLPVVLFVDEPSLTTLSGRSSDVALSVLRKFIGKLRALGAIVGLHCCSNDPFLQMLAADPEIYSFDAHANLELLFDTAPGQLIPEKADQIAWGLIPTTKDLSCINIDQLAERWLRSSKGHQQDRLLAKGLVTASCGLGMLDEAGASMSFQLARELAKKLVSLSSL